MHRVWFKSETMEKTVENKSTIRSYYIRSRQKAKLIMHQIIKDCEKTKPQKHQTQGRETQAIFL